MRCGAPRVGASERVRDRSARGPAPPCPKHHPRILSPAGIAATRRPGSAQSPAGWEAEGPGCRRSFRACSWRRSPCCATRTRGATRSQRLIGTLHRAPRPARSGSALHRVAVAAPGCRSTTMACPPHAHAPALRTGHPHTLLRRILAPPAQRHRRAGTLAWLSGAARAPAQRGPRRWRGARHEHAAVLTRRWPARSLGGRPGHGRWWTARPGCRCCSRQRTGQPFSER